MATVTAIVLSPDRQPLPPAVAQWLAGLDVLVVHAAGADDLMARTLRARPRVVVFDARADESTLDVLSRIKMDSFTGVVPSIVVTLDDVEAVDRAFVAGADEVIRANLSADEAETRLRAALRRSDRDLYVHPSTRLPGTVEIEAEIGRRLRSGGLFATCYADLDHFKEFNDRYSYYDGDRVIRILSKILHDVVKGVCGERGFVGHIGGDDFIFIIPVDDVPTVCGEVVEVFDTLIPLQYSELDRRAGYYFGKDRRGQLHRVPLMTVSIGVVTNERRHFMHAAQISALATEMKSYAKTLPGSKFAIDRRHDLPRDASGGGGGGGGTTGPHGKTEGK